MSFALYTQKVLNACIGNHKIMRYDMSNLEEEYDYETDQDHIARSKRLLETDLFDAVDFFLKEDPLLIIQNFENKIMWIIVKLLTNELLGPIS